MEIFYFFFDDGEPPVLFYLFLFLWRSVVFNGILKVFPSKFRSKGILFMKSSVIYSKLSIFLFWLFSISLLLSDPFDFSSLLPCSKSSSASMDISCWVGFHVSGCVCLTEFYGWVLRIFFGWDSVDFCVRWKVHSWGCWGWCWFCGRFRIWEGEG